MKVTLISENTVREINHIKRPREQEFSHAFSYNEAYREWSSVDKILNTYKTDKDCPVEFVGRVIEVELIPSNAKKVDARLDPQSYINKQFIAKIIGPDDLTKVISNGKESADETLTNIDVDHLIEKITGMAMKISGRNMSDINATENLMESSGFDSLDMVDLIMSVEREYSITIPDDAAEHLLDIKSIAEYVINAEARPKTVFIYGDVASQPEPCVNDNQNGIILNEASIKHNIDKLLDVAIHSGCKRSMCGSIIVDANGNIIGSGYNSLPCNEECQSCRKDETTFSDRFKSDKACCVHAEQRAIMDMLRNGLSKSRIEHSTLFFVRVDTDGNPIPSGQPWCTVCSKLALDVGIANFVLYHESGWTSYNTKTYNDLSFKY